MAFTQSDLDNVRECIASGVLETTFADGRRVRYQTLADLMAAEQRISAAVSASTPGTRSRRRTPAYCRGV